MQRWKVVRRRECDQSFKGYTPLCVPGSMVWTYPWISSQGYWSKKGRPALNDSNPTWWIQLWFFVCVYLVWVLRLFWTKKHMCFLICETSPAAKTTANSSCLLSCLDSCLPPTTPQQPYVTVVSDSEVALSWKPGESEGSSPIQYYSVEFIR